MAYYMIHDFALKIKKEPKKVFDPCLNRELTQINLIRFLNLKTTQSSQESGFFRFA